ncbi:glycoside-pentoside-hexuronide (GPH):cation symporter [Anaeromicropila herbilytica]|uniref:Melibiose:sodium symporter n=1 Tax=Anaeromicropila herbilytica TaxID=2785025 RepID=A0A7R7EJZ8_9FIRM|nr:glycoside-pentoside-hexuronide (GPH):cation symporter [Anaeromicropila herbilytica]BCN30095.1 melibiose:sodium symporter [Anaeromicropila herbilytica]
MGLSNKVKISYGIGAVGKDMVYALVSGFLMYYYNTVLGVSATFIGVLFMGARLFDAFIDPFMGIIVEKTNTRLGKFRPWILGGTLTNAVVLILMFSVPKALHGNPLLVYISIAYVIWGTTYTTMDIPYWSMIPAITESGKDREHMSVIARSFAGIGAAVPTALTMALVPVLGNGSERKGFQVFAVGVALIFVTATVVTVIHVKEKMKINQKSVSVKEMLSSLIKNDQALIVVVAIVMFNASLYLTQQLAVYFFKYDIGNAGLYGVFGMVGGAAQILSMMSLPLLRKKYECKKILVGAIVTALIGYGMLFLLGTFNITNLFLLCIAAVIIFLGFGLATVLTTIFLADTIDYGEWKNHSRNESVIFSLQIFVVKLASAISVLIAGIGLDVIKLNVHKKVQTAETLFGLRLIMLVIPVIGLVLSIMFFVKKYKLSETRLKEITEELHIRRNDDKNPTKENESMNMNEEMSYDI